MPTIESEASTSFCRRLASRLPLACALIVFVVLPSVAGAGPDDGPKPPSNLTLTGATGTELSISWAAPTARHGNALAGYRLYINGSSVGSTTATDFTFAGLTCGSSHTLGVD